MTKKDYIVLARALATSRDKSELAGGEHGAADQWWAVVTCITGALAAGNPLFSKAKFLAACKG